MRTLRTIGRVAALAVTVLLMAAPAAHAVPVLQLYAPGATYDDNTDTWITEASEFDLYIFTDITKLQTTTGRTTLEDLKILVAYGNTGASVTFTPIKAPAPYVDSTLGLTPSPEYQGIVTDVRAFYPDRSPSLWNHDAVGIAVWAETYLLGDSTDDGSTIGDVTEGFDVSQVSGWPETGQINAYHVVTSGVGDDSYVHFDAFDHIDLRNCDVRYYKAPYSHDCEGGPPVPEPATVLLVGAGLLGMGARRIRAIGKGNLR